MSLGQFDLLHPVHLEASRKRSHDMNYPLTPIFNDLRVSGRFYSVIRMSLSGFFAQNSTTNTYGLTSEERDYDAICGNERYRVQTIEGYSSYGDPSDPTFGTLTETFTRSLSFNTTPGSESVFVQQVIEGDSSAGWAPSPTHGQTATFSIQGNPDNDPLTEFNPYLWKEITLSVPVGRAYLEGRLSDWQGESETFRFATDSSIHNLSYATESSDGLAAVNGGHYRISNTNPFSSTLPSPEASDEDLWGGNYFAHILISRRLLSPAVYRETYKTETWHGGGKGKVFFGMGIYNEGFSQDTLSEPITENIWRDEYGVFDEGASLLSMVPKLSSIYFSLPGFSLYYSGAGAGHEIVFITRNGRQTRITLEEVEYVFDVFDEEDPFTVINSVQITTDPNTLRVAHSFPAAAEDDVITDWRVGLVEQYVGDEWVAVGGEEVIGGDVEDQDIKVLYYARNRAGSRWGFLERKEPFETYYKTRVFRKELSVDTQLPEDEDVGGANCGGTVSGGFVLSITETHSAVTGLPLPEVVNEFEMTMDGTDWTVEDYSDVDGEVFGTTTVDTATVLRKERVVSPRVGKLFVRFDEARLGLSSNTAFRFGKLISSEWVKVPVSVDGSQHVVIDWSTIPTANAGECVTIDGFRLSET